VIQPFPCFNSAAMRLVPILLAAGEGRRMGGPKALLRLGNETFASLLCRRFEEAGAGAAIVVLGAQAERVRAEAGLPSAARVVVNDRWAEGMLSSLLCGLDAAERKGVDAVLVHPVDSPFVEQATIAAVVLALRQGAAIAVPGHGGRRGHPAGFASEAFEWLRAADPARGARSVLQEHAHAVVCVPAGPDCLRDVDTPADLP
jgi:CTP:molybdopterin cytidylyltransferase MocA